MYHGDVRLGDTIDIKFCTVQTTGAPFTLAGSPVISAYPANSTTQLTAGITLSVDFDSVTGLNNVRVVASSGNGYLTATDYVLVITTGTVNSVSVVGYCIGSFSIEKRSALMPTTAGRTAVVDAAGLVDANTVKIGPTGAGTAQTARDIGTSVLLSVGTGTGQVDLLSGRVKTTGNVKKNTALPTFPFMMTDSTNHAPVTGKTVTCTRQIDGGAFGAGTLANVIEIGVGIYAVDFATGDLNGNCVTLRCTASGCDDTFERILTSST